MAKLQRRRRFVVLTADSGVDQLFVDYVAAESPEAAQNIIADIRGPLAGGQLVVDRRFGCAFTPAQLRSWADELSGLSLDSIDETIKTSKKGRGDD